MTQAPGSNSIRSFIAWIFSAVLVLGGGGFLLVSSGLLRYDGPIEPLLIGGLAALALPFGVRWLVFRNETWSLLTAWLFSALAIALAVLLAAPAGPYLLIVVAPILLAIPFLMGFLLRRERWYLLVIGYAFMAVSVLLALSAFSLGQEILLGFALLLAALPFWVAWLADRSRQWASIISGLTALFGVLLLAAFSLISLYQVGSPAFYIAVNAALSILLLALWLSMRQWDWALWAAMGFFGSAIVAIFLPSLASLGALALVMGLYIAVKQIGGGSAAKPAVPAAAPASAQAPVAPPAPAAPSAPAAPAPVSSAATTVVSQPTRPITPAVPDNEQLQPGGADQRAVRDFRPLNPLGGRKHDDD